MPWHTRNLVEEREAFVQIVESGHEYFSRVCQTKASKKTCRTWRSIRRPAVAEIQRMDDHNGGVGTLSQPGDACLLQKQKHGGDDQDGGSSPVKVPRLLQDLPLLGRRVMAYFDKA